MVLRVLAAFALIVLVIDELPAQQVSFQPTDTAPKVGDHLAITMTGDLAKDYAKQTGQYSDGKFPDGLQISTIATIEQELNDGRFRFEHSRYVETSGKPTRLVTLTGNVDPKSITIDLPPKAAQVYANPGAEPHPSNTASKMLRLELPDLKGIKLRTWTLSEESGDSSSTISPQSYHKFP